MSNELWAEIVCGAAIGLNVFQLIVFKYMCDRRNEWRENSRCTNDMLTREMHRHRDLRGAAAEREKRLETRISVAMNVLKGEDVEEQVG